MSGRHLRFTVVRGPLLVLLAVVALVGAVLDPPASAASAASAGFAVTELTTNGRIDPLGIGGQAPSFGWRLTSSERGTRQGAYEIRVGRAPGSADVWTSGKVSSDRQVGVVYAGPALQAATRYHWSVRAWTGKDEGSAWSADAFFETGLLTAADWGDAQWITRPSAAGELERWTNYSAVVDFALDNAAIGLFLRASDVNNGYMW